MAGDWWDKPLSVMIGHSTTYNVTSSSKAADILLHRWPTDGGAKHLAARRAVLKAMENHRDSRARAAARRAFEAAAREADILVKR